MSGVGTCFRVGTVNEVNPVAPTFQVKVRCHDSSDFSTEISLVDSESTKDRSSQVVIDLEDGQQEVLSSGCGHDRGRMPRPASPKGLDMLDR